MSMEDSMEANLVMEDIAIEIQWYKDMDEPMEPAEDAWARYWHHHPRPGQEVPADQGADASWHHCQGKSTKSRSQRQLCQSSKCNARWCHASHI